MEKYERLAEKWKNETLEGIFTQEALNSGEVSRWRERLDGDLVEFYLTQINLIISLAMLQSFPSDETPAAEMYFENDLFYVKIPVRPNSVAAQEGEKEGLLTPEIFGHSIRILSLEHYDDLTSDVFIPYVSNSIRNREISALEGLDFEYQRNKIKITLNETDYDPLYKEFKDMEG